MCLQLIFIIFYYFQSHCPQLGLLFIFSGFFTCFSSVWLFSHVQFFVTPWTAAHCASQPLTNSQACSNSWPSSPWCHPTFSSSAVPFSHLQSFPASVSFLSLLFASGGQGTGASGLISFMIDWFDHLWLVSSHILPSGKYNPFLKDRIKYHLFYKVWFILSWYPTASPSCFH